MIARAGNAPPPRTFTAATATPVAGRAYASVMKPVMTAPGNKLSSRSTRAPSATATGIPGPRPGTAPPWNVVTHPGLVEDTV